jgi:hypothetical protein
MLKGEVKDSRFEVSGMVLKMEIIALPSEAPDYRSCLLTARRGVSCNLINSIGVATRYDIIAIFVLIDRIDVTRDQLVS